MEWLINNIGLILGALGTVLSGIITFFVTYKKKGAVSATLDTMQVINKMLPSLIATSENVNTGKTGEAKKEFVMCFIENITSARGVTMTAELKAEISANIDALVALTKTMHTGGARNEKNSGNDARGVAGLRLNVGAGQANAN